MKTLFSRVSRGAESGQTMIFFAVLLSALCLTTGLAVEGGRVFVEYRRLQSAADMAALIGAQKLPCATTDTTCIQSAETQACTYASSNGFSGCTIDGATYPSANVPPKTCSPYDFMDYGNGSTNGSCKTANAPSNYDYIETRLQDNLGQIPIFNVPVTLTAHAVAKRGLLSGSDFALITLDPNTPLNMSGSNTVHTVGSVFANGGITGSGKVNIQACSGGWFTAAASVTGVNTNNSTSPTFAPTGCTGSLDPTPLTAANLPQLADPYAGSAPPTGNVFTNCPECSQPGYWYDGAQWHAGGSPTGSSVELFPGVYNTLTFSNLDQVTFNPGVYTLTGGENTNHGNMCVYGSPSCGNSNCAAGNFSAGTSSGDQWYYSCSPYGFWDSSTFGGTRPAGLPVTPPYFYNSTTPLNGITLYFPPVAGITEHGNGGKYGNVYLAAPNSCPGTGTSSSGPPAISFPAGAAGGVYTYANIGWINTPLKQGIATSAGQSMVYPNDDFTLLGECNDRLQVWNGEFTNPQHLHFLNYIAGPTSLTLTGAASQQQTGIIYAPTSTSTVLGAGKGAGGPPWINGQLIVKSATFSGNGVVDISYRPCGPSAEACGSGSGTQLVQ